MLQPEPSLLLLEAHQGVNETSLTLSAERLHEYRKKAARLRHIHSLKLTWYTRLGNFTTASLVVLSASVTFLGFAGIDRLLIYAKWIDADISREGAEFAFNVLLLLVVILVILDLVYRFRERANSHNHAVVMLANFVNRLDDELAEASSESAEQHLLEVTAARYEVMTEFLPPNTDRQYLRSKRLDPKPDPGSLRGARDAWADERVCATRLEAILSADGWRVSVLRAVREVNSDAVVAGGFVRAPIWDALAGLEVPTPFDDIDVLFHDASDAAPKEAHLEGELRALVPNVRWQVKNQALLHHGVSSPPESLLESLRMAPETASGVGIRVKSDGQFEILAPSGLTDLFRMVLRPREGATAGEIERFEQRLREKRWSATWPVVVAAAFIE